MAGFSARIGEKAGPFQDAVTEDQLRSFRDAVSARSSSIPPTFLTRYRVGEFELFNRLGIALESVLHAEQAYLYGEPVQSGDVLHFDTVLVTVAEKRELSFLTFETRFESDRAGQMLSAGTARTTIVVRGASS